MSAPVLWLAIALSGVVTGLAAAPRDVPALVYVGFAGLTFFFARGMESARAHGAWRRGLGLGFVYGLAINALVLRFSVALLIDFGHMPSPVAVLVSLALWSTQALVHAVMGGIVGALSEAVDRERRALFACAILPPALVVAEHVVPMLFPWRLAAGLASWVPMMQAAELGGEPLLTLQVSVTACAFVALGELAPSGLPGSRARLGVLCAAALLVPFAYGSWRVAAVESARSRATRLRVGLVQPNVGIGDKGRDELAFDHFDRLAAMTRTLQERGAEVVVWPETAAPFSMRRTMRREPEGPWSLLDRGIGVPVLMGVVTWHSVVRKHNSAIVLRPDGTYSEPADKLELIPFGEFTPGWGMLRTVVRAVWPDAPFRPYVERLRGFTPGDAPVLLEVDAPGRRRSARPTRLGVMICYEDILPAIGRRVFHAAGGPPDVLVNMTNDAWFGDGDEPHLHLALSRFRAIETRRDLVRAVNTGVSAAITATGEVTKRTGTFVPAAVIAEVRLLSGTTPYMVLGDWVVSVAFALIASLAAGRATATVAPGRVA